MPTDNNHLPPSPALPEPSLFDSTSIAAGRVAARYAKSRYLQILAYLQEKPGCIFEIAAALSTQSSVLSPQSSPRTVHDHQISGRFSALVKDALIARTGLRRKKPDTGCDCEEYCITLTGLAVLTASLQRSAFPVPRSPSPSSNAPQTPIEGAGGGAH
jgi:hypothetical protein